MIKMHNEGMISERSERFIVMTIHIANKKVKYCHIDNVTKSAAIVERW